MNPEDTGTVIMCTSYHRHHKLMRDGVGWFCGACGCTTTHDGTHLYPDKPTI